MTRSETAIGTYAILAVVVILFVLFPPGDPFMQQSTDADAGGETPIVDTGSSSPPSEQFEPLRVVDGTTIYHPEDPGPVVVGEVDLSRSNEEYERRAFYDNGSVKNETVRRNGVVVERRTYDSATIERAVEERIDEVRRDHDRDAWRWSPLLASPARKHAKDMAVNGFVGHSGTDGSTPLDRIERAWSRHDCRSVRENAASAIAGFPYEDQNGTVHDEDSPRYVASNGDVADSVVRQWMNSESHRELLLAPDGRVAGVGVHLRQGADGELVRAYVTLDVCFG